MGRDAGDLARVKSSLLRFITAWVSGIALVVVVAGCNNPSIAVNSIDSPPPLLLISMDGFRWDYCAQHPEATPNLRRLMREGVTAQGLIPTFPSQTFTNHYSIVTGLYPAHHGIINNVFFDPEVGEYFRYKIPAAIRDPRWWGGEPIWITAEKQGRKGACYFWPGSEVTFAGVKASIAMPFDYSVPFAQRLERLFGWLNLPEEQRPAVTVFYFEEANRVGHYSGPESSDMVATIKLLDEQIGAIVSRAKADGIPLNIVIVSDHGFIATEGTAKTTMLDDYVDLETVQIDFDGPVAGLRPLDGNVDALVHRLRALPPHYHVYRAEDLPARWNMKDNGRIPPVWIVSEPSWRIQRRSTFIAVKDHRLKGEHGFDPALQAMHGLFVASGPSFQAGRVIDAVENVHIYNLLCAALNISAAPNDGDDRLVRAVMKK